MIPVNRDEFKEFCLRALGKPVIEINVSDEQVDDKVDYGLRKFIDFHFEGTEKVYYKWQVTANNRSDAIDNIRIVSGGTGYANGEALEFSEMGHGTIGPITVTTNATGGITALNWTDNGRLFGKAPVVDVDTAGGSGAVLEAELGGFITVPDNIIGAIELFPVGDQAGASNLFNLRYQVVLNDLYMMNNLNIVPYTMAMYNVALIHEILVGKQPLRFNRYKKKLYVDMDWSAINVGDFMIVQAYQVIDPDTYTGVWGDPWLYKYVTANIKEIWGSNLKKFEGLPMVGGMTFNGQTIYNEARQEIAELEQELLNSWTPVPQDFMG